MSDLLIDIETYFISKGLIKPGTLYRDTIPDTPADAVALYEYQGGPIQSQVAGADRSVQVVVRNALATPAKELARKLHNSLQVESGILNLTEERWALVHLRTPPFKLKVDESNRIYYAFNVGMTTYLD